MRKSANTEKRWAIVVTTREMDMIVGVHIRETQDAADQKAKEIRSILYAGVPQYRCAVLQITEE